MGITPADFINCRVTPAGACRLHRILGQNLKKPFFFAMQIPLGRIGWEDHPRDHLSLVVAFGQKCGAVDSHALNAGAVVIRAADPGSCNCNHPGPLLLYRLDIHASHALLCPAQPSRATPCQASHTPYPAPLRCANPSPAAPSLTTPRQPPPSLAMPPQASPRQPCHSSPSLATPHHASLAKPCLALPRPA